MRNEIQNKNNPVQSGKNIIAFAASLNPGVDIAGGQK